MSASQAVSRNILKETVAAYKRSAGNQILAAQALGISRAGLQARLRQATARGIKFKRPDDIALEVSARRATQKETPEDILRRENVELRQSNTRLISLVDKHESRQSIEDRISDGIVESIKANPFRPPMRPYKQTIKRNASPHEFMALISDAHFPEVVEPSATFGLNYNKDICRARMEYLRDKIIRYGELRRTSYDVQKLTVAVIGDMLSGDIHEELEVSNELPMTTALVDMGQMLYDMGRAFRESFPKVEFIVMPGNHPRIQKKPRFKQKWNNWEYAMGYYVKALAGNEFDVTVPKDMVYRHQIFNQTIGLTHGDGIKSNSFAGIPFYGMAQRRNALQSLLKVAGQKQIDMLCYGHWHQLIYERGQGCSLLVNGSIKGGDEYSIGTRYSSQEPVQALVEFHPKHGVTCIDQITLGHIN